jgi:ribosome biogenesis GTPase
LYLIRPDLFKKKEQEKFGEMKSMYEKAGYKVFLTSTKENTGIEALQEELKDKTSLISGHSGVGKSFTAQCYFSRNEFKNAGNKWLERQRTTYNYVR